MTTPDLYAQLAEDFAAGPQPAGTITVKTVFISPEPSERECDTAHLCAKNKAKYHKPKDATEAKNMCDLWAVHYARWFRDRGYSVRFGFKTIPFTGEK